MKTRTSLLAAAAFAVLTLSATSAFAQGRGPGIRDHRMLLPTTRVPAKASPKLSPKYVSPKNDRFDHDKGPSNRFDEPRARRGPAWKHKERELERTRASRRAKSAATTRARWNRGFLGRPAVKKELATHAQRIAKLDRMLRIAQSERGIYGGLIVRINAAIRSENLRHERAMNKLEVTFRFG